MLTAGAILAAVQSGFEFGTELLRYLQTEDGKAMVKQINEDRTQLDAFGKQISGGLRDLFSGELFKVKP